jgi:hypothetical protein
MFRLLSATALAFRSTSISPCRRSRRKVLPALSNWTPASAEPQAADAPPTSKRPGWRTLSRSPISPRPTSPSTPRHALLALISKMPATTTPTSCWITSASSITDFPRPNGPSSPVPRHGLSFCPLLASRASAMTRSVYPWPARLNAADASTIQAFPAQPLVQASITLPPAACSVSVSHRASAPIAVLARRHGRPAGRMRTRPLVAGVLSSLYDVPLYWPLLPPQGRAVPPIFRRLPERCSGRFATASENRLPRSPARRSLRDP